MIGVLFSVCLSFSTADVPGIPAFVITLERHTAKFNDFVARWKPLLTSIAFERFVATEQSVRGRGICLSILDVLHTAERRVITSPILLFEPDALPFADVAYATYNFSAANDYDVYFLGGHNIHLQYGANLPHDQVEFTWTPISVLSGCYGFIVSPRRRLALLEHLHQYCTRERKSYSVDVFLSHCARSVIATPLLVDHPRTSYSETWKRNRTDAWAGQRKWMRLPKYNYGTIECD